MKVYLVKHIGGCGVNGRNCTVYSSKAKAEASFGNNVKFEWLDDSAFVSNTTNNLDRGWITKRIVI